jgi:DNA primase
MTSRPSLVVSPKTNLWHCLGKCSIGGSAIDWVMKTQGVSFRHAVELLKADHPSLAAGEARWRQKRAVDLRIKRATCARPQQEH